MSAPFFNDEMTNRDRALRALRAMREYAGEDYSAKHLGPEELDTIGDVGQETMQDLLCDLRHVAQVAGLDIELAFYNSASHFAEEMAEEE